MPEPIGSMETSEIPTKEIGVKPSVNYFEDIQKANATNKEWQENAVLQERQRKILEQLTETYPTKDSLINHLVSVCLEGYEHEKEFAKKNHRPTKEFDAGKKTRGELFEIVVGAENDVFDLFSETHGIPKLEKSEEQRKKEQTFIEVFTNPEKYDFPYMDFFSIPDIPFIVTREGDHLVLRAVAEVKLGEHLDARAYGQLLPSGIRKSLEFTLTRLNSLSTEEAAKRGLDGFGIGKEMYMLKKFEQLVILARGVKVEDKDFLIKREGLNLQEFFDFKKILDGKHPDSNVTLVNSSFSRNEIYALYGSIIQEVISRFKAASPQTI